MGFSKRLVMSNQVHALDVKHKLQKRLHREKANVKYIKINFSLPHVSLQSYVYLILPRPQHLTH
jgi:hypothetical protein